jgi:hypothetical protein
MSPCKFQSLFASVVPCALVGALFALQPAAAQCDANLATYCTAGTSAGGCVASISGFGIPSTNAPSGFDVVVGAVPGQRSGMLHYGFAPAAVPYAAGSSSFRCVAAPFQRLGALSSGGAAGQCNGSLALDLNTWLSTHPSALGAPYSAGQTLFVQGWFRDPGAPGAANLSNGLTFSLCAGAGAPPMFVASCSLACSGGSGGAQVSCGQTQGFVNQPIAIDFSEPVDPASIWNGTLLVLDVSNGTSALGARFVDPNDPRRVVFRPSLQFDAAGNAQFGLAPNATYAIQLAGTAQLDSGPFVFSVLGEPNASRMFCTFTADQGIQDYVPGAPQVSLFVLVSGSATPVEISGGAIVDVQTNSPLTFVYADVMDVATLLNPTTGSSPFVSVELDVDGNLQTFADRVPIPGAYSFAVDVSAATTTVVFAPTGGWPSGGTGTPPQRVVVNVPGLVRDVAGNGLANPGLRTFVAQ